MSSSISPASISPVESRTDVLLESLRVFYTDPAHTRILTDALKTPKTKISLRTLDWLCTNYAKKRNVVYRVGPRTVNVYLEYKAALKAFSKKAFDPFQRRDRIQVLDALGEPMNSTAGQLNFFRFAIRNGVLDYARRHAAEIEADMLGAIRHRTTAVQGNAVAGDAAPKRRELSRAATHGATASNITVTIRFL